MTFEEELANRINAVRRRTELREDGPMGGGFYAVERSDEEIAADLAPWIRSQFEPGSEPTG